MSRELYSVHGERARIYTGFSETEKHVSGLANKLSETYDDVEVVTLPQADRYVEKIRNEDLRDTDMWTHSAGIMTVSRIFRRDGNTSKANSINVLCGVEPTPQPLAILYAGRAALNSFFDHSGCEATLADSLRELKRNPSHLSIVLGRIATFSTTTQLICLRDRFPGGIFYGVAEKDEFKFGNQDTINTARRYGMTAAYLGEKANHNYPLTHPRETVDQIRQLLEVQASAEPIAS